MNGETATVTMTGSQTEDVTLYAKWTRKSSSGSGTSPKTGDPLAGAFAIVLALAAASALTLAASRRRSRG